jgi:hypothetical protein
MTATTTSGGNWLTVSSAAGTVAGSNVMVDVGADWALLASGTYTGQLELRATVNGAAVTSTVPVTARIEGNRLLVSDTGVAFSSFPSRQVLTRTLAVRNTRDETGVPWQASESATWLQTTLTGNTGDPLVLTADPTGLSAGQYFANVTVISPSARIVNTETIRVGLTVRTMDPASVVNLPTANGSVTVANPVEPEVFLIRHPSNDIEVYDVYSGASLRTFPATGGVRTSLAMSADGLSLYVGEDGASSDQVHELDPETGTVRRSFVVGTNVSFPSPSLIAAYARPDAHPVLVTTIQGQIFDATTGALFTASIAGTYLLDHSIAVSSDQRYVFTMNSGISPATIYRYGLRYSSLAPAGLIATRQIEASLDGQPAWPENGQDIALSESDEVLYTASGFPYRFDLWRAINVTRVHYLDGAPYPNNVETCWNDRVAGGADASGEALGDIWVYTWGGAPLARLDSGTDALFARSLKFSGDCTRLVSASGSGLRIQAAP